MGVNHRLIAGCVRQQVDRKHQTEEMGYSYSDVIQLPHPELSGLCPQHTCWCKAPEDCEVLLV